MLRKPEVHGKTRALARSAGTRWGAPTLAFGMVLIAIWTLRRYAAGTSWQDVVSALDHQPAMHLAGALGLTAVSFAALGFYDLVASRVVAPGRVPAWVALFAGAAGNAVSNTLGFHAVTGSAIRLRIYGRCGLGPADALRVISLSWLALGLGFLAMIGAGLVWGPAPVIDAKPAGEGRLLAGLAIWTALAGMLVWLARRPRVLAWRAIRMPFPPAWASSCLIIAGAIESGAAIGALRVLLPSDLAPSFAVLAVAYIASTLLGVAAHVPGGLGVFEVALTSLLGAGGRADWLAALLLYRLVYNIVPFVSMSLALALFELWHGSVRGRSQFDGG